MSLAALLEKVPTAAVAVGLKLNALLDVAIFMDLPPGLLDNVAPLAPGVLSPAGGTAFYNAVRWAFLMHGAVRYAAGHHIRSASHRNLALVSYAIEALQIFFAARSGVLTTSRGPMPVVLFALFVLYFKNFGDCHRTTARPGAEREENL